MPVIKKSISLLLNLTYYFAIVWFSPKMETLVKRQSSNKFVQGPLPSISIMVKQ